MWTLKRPARPGIPTLAITTSLWAAFAGPGTALTDIEAQWRLLAEVEIEEHVEDGIWTAEKRFPDALLAAREGFEIEGYLVPITPEAFIETFLLVEDPADCPFCGSSGYGPALEVELRHPLRDLPEFSRIRVRGELQTIEDPETYQALRLVDAITLPPSHGN